ncbi:MAG: hypothetical protein J2P25_21560 [Nocardiopsaceae bacterium]|nr:hypothetical protein [Nocardiopsaceae bacterium]
MATELILFADYHQIHVFDEESETDLGNYWNDEAYEAGIVVADDAVGIVTSTDLDVGVSVEVLQEEPPAGDATGRIVEGELHVPSGRVVVMGCTDFLPDAARFEVGRGRHRVRVARLPLDPAADDPDIEERLRLSIWPV